MHRRLANSCFALAALVLLLGLARGGGEAPRNRIPRTLRMLSSALVWTGALILWRGAAGEARARAGLAAAGMGFGLLGDLIMAKVVPTPNQVIFGMLAFGAGHAQYMRAAGRLAQTDGGRRTTDDGPQTFHSAAHTRWPAGALVASGVVGAAGWRALAYGPAQPVAVNAASLAYALLLSSMAGVGASLATHDARHAPLAVGGALFFLSDLILAGELFRELFFPHIGDTVWLTYLAGQGLIVAGLNEEG